MTIVSNKEILQIRLIRCLIWKSHYVTFLCKFEISQVPRRKKSITLLFISDKVIPVPSLRNVWNRLQR